MEARLLYEEALVRLHVLADSDEDRAQRVKMGVVRAIRHKAAGVAARAENAQQAFDRLCRARGRLCRAARRAARRQGFYGKVAVETGLFDFPDRDYGGQLVPAGRYRAVRVKLGSASGKNWWCVLYPQLCAVEESCAQALSSPEAIHFYSSIGRFLQSLLRGVGL